MEKTYGFNEQGVSAIRDTVNMVLGTPINIVGEKRVRRGSSPAASSYTGPWAVVRKDDTTVTVKHSNDYELLSRIIYGLTSYDLTDDVDVAITTTGIVYLKLSYSGGYAVTFGNAATLPAQTVGNYYVSLAFVVFQNSSQITYITQLQTTDIHVAGRIV